jgi:hypothetical protein
LVELSSLILELHFFQWSDSDREQMGINYEVIIVAIEREQWVVVESSVFLAPNS